MQVPHIKEMARSEPTPSSIYTVVATSVVPLSDSGPPTHICTCNGCVTARSKFALPGCKRLAEKQMW